MGHKLTLRIVSIAASLLLSSAAYAVPFSIDFGPSSSNDAGADFRFDLYVPTSITGDATLSLTLDGDFWILARENAMIELDGFSLGTVADRDPSNDLFDFANNDNPDSSSAAGSPFTGTALIANADFASLITDGLLTLFINTSNSVNASTTTVLGTLSFDAPATSVPEPNTFALLSIGLVGFWFARRRRDGCHQPLLTSSSRV